MTINWPDLPPMTREEEAAGDIMEARREEAEYEADQRADYF